MTHELREDLVMTLIVIVTCTVALAIIETARPDLPITWMRIWEWVR